MDSSEGKRALRTGLLDSSSPPCLPLESPGSAKQAMRADLDVALSTIQELRSYRQLPTPKAQAACELAVRSWVATKQARSNPPFRTLRSRGQILPPPQQSETVSTLKLIRKGKSPSAVEPMVCKDKANKARTVVVVVDAGASTAESHGKEGGPDVQVIEPGNVGNPVEVLDAESDVGFGWVEECPRKRPRIHLTRTTGNHEHKLHRKCRVVGSGPSCLKHALKGTKVAASFAAKGSGRNWRGRLKIRRQAPQQVMAADSARDPLASGGMSGVQIALDKCQTILFDADCRRAADAVHVAQSFASLTFRREAGPEDMSEDSQRPVLFPSDGPATAQVVRSLLALALSDLQNEAKYLAPENLKRRLLEDDIFAEAHVLAAAQADDVAADLKALGEAKQNGVLFGEELYSLKIKIVRDEVVQGLQVAARGERDRIMELRKQVAFADRLLADLFTLGSPLTVASDFPTLELLKRVEACSPPEGAACTDHVYRRGYAFACALLQSVLRATREPANDAPLLAASSIILALCGAVQSLQRPQREELHARRTTLHSQRETDSVLMQDALAAAQRAEQNLRAGEGDLAALKDVLQRITDQRVHHKALEELTRHEQHKAGERLALLNQELHSVEQKLEHCSSLISKWKDAVDVFQPALVLAAGVADGSWGGVPRSAASTPRRAGSPDGGVAPEHSSGLASPRAEGRRLAPFGSPKRLAGAPC
mmetsp:Transcript_89343/g.207963  ORF Transcript_89343/g.207963 Transcript_89343/m.207963 type:complete len:711 (-) Transcript_89343:67-2199(-)